MANKPINRFIFTYITIYRVLIMPIGLAYGIFLFLMWQELQGGIAKGLFTLLCIFTIFFGFYCVLNLWGMDKTVRKDVITFNLLLIINLLFWIVFFIAEIKGNFDLYIPHILGLAAVLLFFVSTVWVFCHREAKRLFEDPNVEQYSFDKFLEQ